MGPTPAVDLLLRSGTPFRLHEYRHDPSVPSYGREAAEALETDPDRVFKTLVTSADARHAIAVIPVSSELDLKAFAQAVGAKKAGMAAPRDAERITGYVLGGVSPLGQKRQLESVLDDSSSGWETVFVSGGRRGLEIELAPGDLVRLIGGRYASVARFQGS